MERETEPIHVVALAPNNCSNPSPMTSANTHTECVHTSCMFGCACVCVCVCIFCVRFCCCRMHSQKKSSLFRPKTCCTANVRWHRCHALHTLCHIHFGIGLPPLCILLYYILYCLWILCDVSAVFGQFKLHAEEAK